ncbi:class I SAM-dependent RNA methyltransferase [Mangrovimicrobium sediminis]|uniref:Class I SAM-dependent RNA methyltransferase n=1 Tax=Mangrovimicrobium sediminis TaxID=2562682 RepID=A0A4Z0M2Q8_9GAMM|nr:TRAM domain-containing protein [Haliea sp. SAOS-164]TGD73973.1 class I SAM-dependent RNA methyltransferase [Haliea sp. SAOS-164]
MDRTTLVRGAVFTASVRDLGGSGHAVVEHPSGQVVFVPGAWPGEVVQVRVTEVKSRFARGVLLAVEQPGAPRRTPPCAYHGNDARHCGGCPWQFVAYPAQCVAKQQRVVAELARLGIGEDIVQPIIPSDSELGYRNRAQLRSDGRRLGFLAEGGRELVDVESCPVLDAATAAHLAELRAALPAKQWRPARRGQWTRIDIDGELGVSVNARLPFRQGNNAQNTRMRAWLAERLTPLAGGGKALELFAGSGNFTRVLAQAGFDSIVAVEAVAAATSALAALGLPGVSVVQQDLYAADAYGPLLRAHGDARLLLLDPPRDGLQAAPALFGARSALRDVLYVSCDLATFCRDVRVMQEAGFVAEVVQPLDLFPQTPHVELLAHFSRA